MKKLNRRSFLEVVSGFIAGVVALALPSKRIYSSEAGAGIDPNSQWAKQKPLTLDELDKFYTGVPDIFKEGDFLVRSEESVAKMKQGIYVKPVAIKDF